MTLYDENGLSFISFDSQVIELKEKFLVRFITINLLKSIVIILQCLLVSTMLYICLYFRLFRNGLHY